MATYPQIQDWVRATFGYVPKTCWIADLKAEYGLTTRVAVNRELPNKRKHPCPPGRRQSIKTAFKHFGMI